jgi:hypothetical protein
MMTCFQKLHLIFIPLAPLHNGGTKGAGIKNRRSRQHQA